MFYLDILYSASSDKYYVGTNSDIERRLFEHNISGSQYLYFKTSSLDYKKDDFDGTESLFAMRVERAVKKTKS